MRGETQRQSAMLCLINIEDRIPRDHPLRAVKKLADAALERMSPLFDEMYSQLGRASIPPERLLKGSLLMALYTLRSERQLCEQLNYNMMFRWFMDMDMVEPSFNHSVFSKNRERLLKHDTAGVFFREVVDTARWQGLVSAEHFTVDGTLIDAWASLKSFKRKDSSPSDPPDDPGNPTVNFHGEKRCNDTHESTTDPEARLMRKGKGKEAKLSFMGHALMENRHGLLVDLQISEANGTAERTVALDMLDANRAKERRATVGGDKNYDTKGFIAGCRDLNVTPQVAQNTGRRGGSAIDRRTTRHEGYTESQRVRKRVEEIFGWAKTVGGLRRTRYKGRERTQLAAYLVGAAYNLLRIARLKSAPT